MPAMNTREADCLSLNPMTPPPRDSTPRLRAGKKRADDDVGLGSVENLRGIAATRPVADHIVHQVERGRPNTFRLQPLSAPFCPFLK